MTDTSREAQRIAAEQEDRVVELLRQRGLVHTTTTRPWIGYLKLSGAAVALVASFFLGAQFGSQNQAENVPVVEPIKQSDTFSHEFMAASFTEESIIEDTDDPGYVSRITEGGEAPYSLMVKALARK